MPPVKRTYSSRKTAVLPGSPQRKRPLTEISLSENLAPPAKRRKQVAKPSAQGQKTLTQLHFCVDRTILRACPRCQLSYIHGAPDDESLHRSHCARVQRGMEWGREEERDKIKAGVVEVATGVRLKDGQRGRIICFGAGVGGKIGSKLSTLLRTINTALSSPELMPAVLHASKAYLFLVPQTTSPGREKIIGCVIAQRISTAMVIASQKTCVPTELGSPQSSPNPADGAIPTEELVPVDPNAGIFCNPSPLPTPLGIPRIFVATSHRRQGVATRLLDSAAETFIYGCPLDPLKGQVAFTQPTSEGAAILASWGKGGVRIYEE